MTLQVPEVTSIPHSSSYPTVMGPVFFLSDFPLTDYSSSYNLLLYHLLQKISLLCYHNRLCVHADYIKTAQSYHYFVGK